MSALRTAPGVSAAFAIFAPCIKYTNTIVSFFKKKNNRFFCAFFCGGAFFAVFVLLFPSIGLDYIPIST
jgi:hypothetical protein